MRLETPADGDELVRSVQRSGYAWVVPEAARSVTGMDARDWQHLRDYWSRLPQDPHLKDGGRYRFRRHCSLLHDVAGGVLTPVPHRAHWQPLEYNALHGGMTRWFEPIETGFLREPAFTRSVVAIGELVARARPASRWFVEIHQVRIDTASGIGRPTPEGAHRDGVDFVAVWLAGCEEIRGGESRVFEANGPHGVRFTLGPRSAVVLDDTRVIHETTPILPAASPGMRDTLVVTYRAQGFLEPARP